MSLQIETLVGSLTCWFGRDCGCISDDVGVLNVQAILLNMRELQGEVASSSRRRPEPSKSVKADALPAAARKRLKMEKHPAVSQSDDASEKTAAAEELRKVATPESEVQSAGNGLGIPRWAWGVGIFVALNYLFSD
ncbi:unnamed protein product [Phytophthora fragariaefolia]|uniref:Unnamed protein product n=1 Tax=Phytophthora fragariaefolia TaxID=1490495 RepID=A0A9W6U7S6_9STRA|nr:unnamed protein product [Phytophthora fragariaefolia]